MKPFTKNNPKRRSCFWCARILLCKNYFLILVMLFLLNWNLVRIFRSFIDDWKSQTKIFPPEARINVSACREAPGVYSYQNSLSLIRIFNFALNIISFAIQWVQSIADTPFEKINNNKGRTKEKNDAASSSKLFSHYYLIHIHGGALVIA